MRIATRPLLACAARIAARTLIAVAVAAPLGAQRPHFSPTLSWDAGLVNTPAAYVPPLGGDLAISFSRIAFDSARMPAALARSAGYDFSVSASAFGRAELGVSIFSADLKSGLFAKVLVWDQTDGIWRRGVIHWLPSVAVGVRNLGTEKSLNRLSRTGLTQLKTSPTLYAVLTRSFVLAEPVQGARPRAQLALSAGVGNGLFSDDGGLKQGYAKRATGGAFGGAQLQFAAGRFATFSLVAEHDAWDVNAGAQLEVRGLRASLYVLELGAGRGQAPYATQQGAGGGQAGSLAQRKVAFSLGWQTNLSALVRGNRMERRAEQFSQEADALRRQIRSGEGRVTALETQLRTLQTAAGAEKQAELEELKRQLREEQEAVRRLQELLRQREARKP